MTEVANDVMERLYGRNIWVGIKPTVNPPDVPPGWNGTHDALTRLAKESELIVDVGVFKGQSTTTLAKALKEAGTDGVVISIDTFLGSSEHWYTLTRQNGFPNLYQTFLENVEQYREYVVPMPQISTVAAMILGRLYIYPDLIHIDASHHYDDVKQDIYAFWQILRPGGYLIGDDYDWADVKKAADEFANAMNLHLEIEHPKWIVRKPCQSHSA